MAKDKQAAKDEAAEDDFPYMEAAPGQFLFAQDWEQQSFDCQSRLLKEGLPSSRRMLASAHYPASQVNGAAAVPGDPGQVWPQLILVTVGQGE